MSGALMELVAYGAQDVYLTGNPQITFFKVAYRRHTNFSMQAMTVVPSGASGFDKIMNFTIPRNGDLITNTYLKVQLREVRDEEFNGKFAWVKRLGHALIDYATLTIGGSQIDKQYGIWLDLWYELTHSKSQEKGYRQMIGDVPELTKFSEKSATGVIKKGYTLFVPLQFWFCRNPGLALPLIALQYHDVKVELKTAHKDHLIVYAGDFKSSDAYSDLELGDINLLVNYVFLDSEERRKFAQIGHEYLIEQLQFTGAVPVPNTVATTPDTEVHHSVQLNFNHPSKELVWALRNGNTRGKKFLAYTSSDDWTAALDDAANNLAYGMFYIADAAIDATIDKQLVDVSGDVETASGHKISYTYEVINSDSETTETTETFKLWCRVAPMVKGEYNLADKIDNIAISVVKSGETFSISKIIVLAHTMTVRDISIPVAAWTDKRVAKYDDIMVNIPFNYGLLIDGSANPLFKGLIQFNGQDRIDEREGMFFNCVQPLQHHTTTPADGVNVYSFAINPEAHQPSGTANLSRIDTTYLQLKYKDITQKEGEPSLGAFSSETQLYVFDFNYNVLRIISGMGGLAYSN